MSDTNIEEILKLSSEERYDFFLSIVAEERDIWILINDNKEFLKIHSQDLDVEFLPIWPISDFAQEYANNAKETLSPKSISLPEFFAKWVPGLKGDQLDVGVFPNHNAEVWVMEPSELKNDLQDELSNFLG